MSCDQQLLQQIAQQQGMRVGVIHSDKGVPAVLLEAMDDTGDYMEAQELNKASEAGQVQARISGRV